MGKLEEEFEFDKQDTKELKLFYALLRKKDNPGLEQQIILRQIIHNRDTDYKVLLTRIQETPGIWRIQETINSRDVHKARKELMIRLLNDDEHKYDDRIDSLWKTCLMQPANKAENNLLLDVDTQDEIVMNKIKAMLKENNVKHEIFKTVHGYHIKTEKFDTRKLTELNIQDVEVKHDSLVLIAVVDTRKKE